MDGFDVSAPTPKTRIPINNANGVTGALFGVAILTYVCRLYIQLYVFRRFPIEDWFILFSVIVLIGATALWYASVTNLYNALAIILDGAGGLLLIEVLDEIPTEAKQANALSTLWWFVIFPVKLGYLLFFKKLIHRLKHLTRYWWFVVGFMVPALIINEVVAWRTCPYTQTVDLISKCSGSESSLRTIRITTVTSVFDILSDIFIASIPIALLWRVRMSLRQKVGLGVTLCLSLVMAVVALVRAGGMRLATGDADIVWLTFWMQNECNICVTMISFTAFRSFFARESDTARDAHPFLWSMLSFQSIKSSLLKKFGGLFRRSGRSDETPTVDSGETMIQSGGGSGMGSNPLDGGSGSSSGDGLGSRESARSQKPMLVRSRPMKEVKIPNGRFSSLWSAIDRAGRTRNESTNGSMV